MLITKILGLFYFSLSLLAYFNPFEGVQGWENPFTLWLLTQGWLHFRWNFSSPWYTHRGTLHRLSDGALNDRTNVGPLPRLWYPAPLDCAPTVKKHIHVNKTDTLRSTTSHHSFVETDQQQSTNATRVLQPKIPQKGWTNSFNEPLPLHLNLFMTSAPVFEMSNSPGDEQPQYKINPDVQ